MKILILAVEITPYFINSYKVAREAGNELYVLHYTSKDSAIEVERELDFIGIKHKNCFDLNLLKMIIILKKFNPDVLICAGWRIFSYMVLCWLTKSKRVLITDSKWQATLKQKFAVKIRRLMIKPFFDYAFVPGSPQEVFMQKLGFSNEKIFKGLLAVSAPEFEKIPITQSERALLYVGRLSPEKGVQRMLEGYKIYRRISHDPFQLWIAGNGELYSELPRIRGVRFLGYVPNSELPRLIQKSRALVLLSHQESWGVVIAESVANSRPVICSDSCGAGVDLIEDGTNGIVLKNPTPEDISRAFQEFESISRSKLEEMSAANEKFAEIYSPNSWVSFLKKISN